MCKNAVIAHLIEPVMFYECWQASLEVIRVLQRLWNCSLMMSESQDICSQYLGTRVCHFQNSKGVMSVMLVDRLMPHTGSSWHGCWGCWHEQPTSCTMCLKPRETQRSPEKPRETQRNPDCTGSNSIVSIVCSGSTQNPMVNTTRFAVAPFFPFCYRPYRPRPW